MIVLVTGAPGAGKTACVVHLISGAEYQKRPLYVSGIPELTIPHQPLDDSWLERTGPEDAGSGREGVRLSEVPDGAVLVIDEAQRVYRPSSKVPPGVSALETHRHHGLDLILVTQHPNLLHSNVRRLVGRHVHLRDVGVLGRWWYEWPEATDPGRYGSAPVKVRYRLPRKVLSRYKSATEHHRQPRRLPGAVWWMLAGVGVVVFAGFQALTGGMVDRVRPTASVVHPQPVPVMPGAGSVGVSAEAGVRAPDLVTAPWPSLFERAASDAPESAPLYRAVLKVVSIPGVVGCVEAGSRCRCYTQQGADAEVSEASCRARLARWPHDPFRAEAVGVARARPDAALGAAPAAPELVPAAAGRSGGPVVSGGDDAGPGPRPPVPRRLTPGVGPA